MTKKDLYDSYRNNIQNVYEVISSVFGKKDVQLQIPTFESIAKDIPASLNEATSYIADRLNNSEIIIHFDELTVTNEANASHKIYDVFIRILVNASGKLNGTFEIKRTTFTGNEIKRGYVHSHAPSCYANSMREWRHMCLGTGPIRNTMNSLRYNPSEENWLLFCTELVLYLQTESLSGGPYINMSSLAESDKIVENDLLSPVLASYPSGTTSTDVRDVTKSLMEHFLVSYPMKFAYIDHKWCLGDSLFNYILYTSKLVDSLVYKNFMISINFNGKDIMIPSEEVDIPRWWNDIKDTDALVFNGVQYKYKIKEIPNDNKSIDVIHPEIVKNALNAILLLINRYYVRENNTRNTTRYTTTNTGTQETSVSPADLLLYEYR